MRHQILYGRKLVAVISLLLVATANLTSASPVLSDDSPSKKVVDYNAQIGESGEHFNETIEVDTERQTELFKVPAHGNVDHSNILNDFKTNLSLLLMPEKKICYLLRLEKDLPAPAKLASDMDKAERIISKKIIIANKWTAGQKLTDRSILSDEMAAFCAEYPIYYVKELEDTMTLSKIQTNGRKNRKRRQLGRYVPLDEYVCDGGIADPFRHPDDFARCLNERKIWQVRCRITSRTCYQIVVCPTFDYCYNRHLTNTFFCCEYICEQHPNAVGEVVTN